MYLLQVENYTLKMQRRDIGENVIEIKHSAGLDRWLVVKKTLDASHISIKVGDTQSTVDLNNNLHIYIVPARARN